MSTRTALDDPVIALGDQHAELAGILAGLGDAHWGRPTRCEGWTVSDVVLHLAQSDELAIASLEDRFAEGVSAMAAAAGSASDDGGGSGGGPGGIAAGVDAWAAAGVAAQRDLPAAEIHQRWRQRAADLRGALAQGDTHRRVTWVGGQMTVTTLATTRLSEAWIHAGDVAEAVGVPLEPDERLRHVARLAWRTLPYAFGQAGRTLDGPVAFLLEGPGGDTWEFVPDGEASTVVRGSGLELCEVAAQRRDAAATSLEAEGPDAEAVLALVRTYA
jgi:uncharacterized protein (TIGR03084 family)